MLPSAKYNLLRQCMFFIRRQKHVFQSDLNNFSDLKKIILGSIIYNRHGIVAVNKPSGISYSSGIHQQDSLNSSTIDVSLKNVIPLIEKHLEYKLYNVKIPEREVSGVCIFAKSESLSNKINMRLRAMRELKEPAFVYEAVVMGQPKLECGVLNAALCLKQNLRQKKVSLLSQWSNNSVKNGKSKRVSIHHSVLATNGETSLVEVCSTSTKWHCPRVFLASHLMTPVLGDQMFGSWVKSILGAPVKVNVFSEAASTSQKIPASVLTPLELSTRKDVKIPLHLHLSEVRINNLLKGEKEIVLKAPSPHYFIWTCERLNLLKENKKLLQQI